MKIPLQLATAAFALCITVFADDPPKKKRGGLEPEPAATVMKKSSAQLKAEKIILPKVDFRESTIRAALEFLTLKSKQLDPDGEGVNLICKLDQPESPEGRVGRPPRPPQPPGYFAVTLQLRDVPLSEVLKYVADLAGLTIRWDEYAAFIGEPATAPAGAADAAEKPDRTATRLRAEKILVPKIDFRESTVRSALDFLALKSSQLDPDGKRVNIIMMLDEPEPQKVPPAPGVPGVDADPGNTALRAPITLTLGNAPLSEAVRYIAELGGLGVRWDEHAAFVWKPTVSPASKEGAAKSKPTKPRPGVKNNAGKGGEKILAHYAKQPVVPKVDFRETTLHSAIEFLVLKHKQLDNDGMGMNLVLKLDDTGGGAGEQTVTKDSLTLTATEIPLFEVLRYIAELNGLDVSLEPNAILITPPTSLNKR